MGRLFLALAAALFASQLAAQPLGTVEQRRESQSRSHSHSHSHPHSSPAASHDSKAPLDKKAPLGVAREERDSHRRERCENLREELRDIRQLEREARTTGERDHLRLRQREVRDQYNRLGC